MAALEPELANYLDYPLSESFTIRFAVAYAWIGIFSGLVGVMELPLLDQAVFSAASFGKIFPFLVCSIVIAIGGSTTDGLNNEPLRSPILSVDRTIQFAIDTQGQAVDNRLALDMHLGAIHPVQDLLERPRRLVVASFDQQMVQIRVMVNFGGEWVECTTFSNHLSYCKRASS